MTNIKRFLSNEYVLVYMFCVAVMAGPAISALFANDISIYTDCTTYLGLASWDFNQDAVRRYRPIVPLAAGVLNSLFGGLFEHLAPSYFKGNFSLPFSFFLVNISLFGLYGTLIYKYCKAYGAGILAAIGGVLIMLTSRYTAYYAGLALVESLFMVTIALALLGIKEKNETFIVLSIFIGPFAKEAYIFIMPVVLFYSHVKKSRLLVYLILSGMLVFGFRYAYESLFNLPVNSGLKVDLQHIPNIKLYLPTMLSFQGIYKIVSSVWIWLLLPVIGILLAPGTKRVIKQSSEGYMLLFFMLVVLQMLLSGSMERMFYEMMPVLCMYGAVIYQSIFTEKVFGKNKFL